MKKKLLVLVSMLLLPVLPILAQGNNPWVQQFKNFYYKKSFKERSYQQIYTEQSLSGDAFDFMGLGSGIDALNAMYRATNDAAYKNECMTLINNVLNTAKPGAGTGDNFMGWVSKNETRTDVAGKSVVLFEGYFFRNMAEFLYTLKSEGLNKLSAADQQWYNDKLEFLELNVWTKWSSRGNSRGKLYPNFLRNRTHMSAHWAAIGLILDRISTNPTIRQQGRDVYQAFDQMLRKNLKPNPVNNTAYSWNMTWDSDLGISTIQDVSHGNHVVDYIVTAVQLNNSDWSVADIKALANTVKYVTYNPATNTFYDNVDRSSIGSRGGSGEFQAWGWVKLAQYDNQLQQLYTNWVAKDPKAANRYTQAAQLFANLALNYKVLHSK